MKVRDSWACLISQTGTELVRISKITGVIPGYIFTNNPSKIPQENLRFLEEMGARLRLLPFRPTADCYLDAELLNKELITLHGYLRIIPAKFFEHYRGKIYNGHPALISEYPELKGFNMQEAIVGKKEQYPWIGSVVHEVIPELDAGKIVVHTATKNTVETIEQAYEVLRQTSLSTWLWFFEKEAEITNQLEA